MAKKTAKAGDDKESQTGKGTRTRKEASWSDGDISFSEGHSDVDAADTLTKDAHRQEERALGRWIARHTPKTHQRRAETRVAEALARKEL